MNSVKLTRGLSFISLFINFVKRAPYNLKGFDNMFPIELTTGQLLFNVLLSFVIGFLTAQYAQTKGRNPTAWFALGFFFSVFAPLILLFLPSLKPDEPTMTVSTPPPDRPIPPPIIPQISQEENQLWYYLDQQHEQKGPVSLVALRELWNTGRLELSTYVWSEGMVNWEIVDNLPKLKEALHKRSDF
jgi:hypothetical protein